VGRRVSTALPRHALAEPRHALVARHGGFSFFAGLDIGGRSGILPKRFSESFRQMRARPTIKDVAQRAGVSPSTVSVVLNDVDGARVAAETRRRVMAAAEQLGYAADPTARALRTQKTRTIGFVSDAIATTPYAGQMVQGAQDAAWQHGVLMLLLNTDGDREHEREAIRTLVHRRVDGIVYATWFHRVIEPPQVPEGMPLVLLDARPAEPTVPWVVPDERAGAAAAVQELLAHGHRRIGFVHDAEDVPAAGERLRAYRETLEAHGIPFDAELIAREEASAAGGRRALPRLLDLATPPTGVFCFNDRMAMGVYQAAGARARIPEELSVVGFDDQPEIAEALLPGLTTVALPHRDMGVWAVERLLAAGDDAALEMRMACPLIRRQSVRSPPDAAVT
jgi:LacI family transcriptional regulator